MRKLVADDTYLREWMRLVSQRGLGIQTKRFAMLAAIEFGLPDLVDMLLSFGDFEWHLLFQKPPNANGEDEDDQENGDLDPDDYEEAEKHEGEDEVEGDDNLTDFMFKWSTQSAETQGHHVPLERAVARCARNGRLGVFLEIVRSNVYLRSLLVPYLSVALRYSILGIGDAQRSSSSLYGAGMTGNARRGQTHNSLGDQQTYLDCIQNLIDQGADVNGVFFHGGERYPGTVLVTAIEQGDYLIIDELVRRGANINYIGLGEIEVLEKRTKTPLAAAILARNHKLVDRLISMRAAVNFLPGNICSWGPLSAAVQVQDVVLIHGLLLLGAQITEADMRLAMKTPKILQVLLRSLVLDDESRERTNAVNGALEQAIQNNMKGAVSLIMESKLVDVNFCLHGKRPLFSALNTKNIPSDFVKLLLSSGAHPNMPSLDLNNEEDYPLLPLHQAISCHCYESTRLLLQYGALPNATPAGSYLTPLCFAISYRDQEIAYLLLNYGADPNPLVDQKRIDNWYLCDIINTLSSGFWDLDEFYCKNTPLQIAAKEGCKGIAEILIEHGASVNAPANADCGGTALQYAAIYGYIGIAVLLLENGANVNAEAAEINGRTALEGAAENGRIDMVQLLLNAGADIYGEGEAQYERALNFASSKGHHAVRELLEDHHGGEFCRLENAS